MADLNLVSYNSTHSYSSTPSAPPRASVFNTYAGSYSADDNFSTKQGLDYSIGDGAHGEDYSYTITSEHTFPVTRTVNSIKYRIYARAAQGGAGGSSCELYVQYKVGGNWNTLSGSSHSDSGGQNYVSTYDTGEVTYSTPIDNVQAVRAYCNIHSWTTEGVVSGIAYIYEIQAFGEPYEDIGLRYYNNGIKKIGVLTNSASCKGKIIKDSIIYGIPIVDTTDARAGLRITLSGGVVKALPIVE
jgi:hypothetical protein